MTIFIINHYLVLHPHVIGDINDDGRINTIGALACFRIALGVVIPTPDEACRADADHDGRITTIDALCVYREALGIPNDCFSI